MTPSLPFPDQFITLCRQVEAIRREQRLQRWFNRIAGVVVAALLLLTTSQRACGQPAAELAKAVRDLATLPPEAAANARYLSLYNLPAGEAREQCVIAISMIANSSSRSTLIAVPVRVDETLLRIDLAAYGWEPDLWDALISDGEPYWHLTTEIATQFKTGRPTLVGFFRLNTASGPSGWYTAAQISRWLASGELAPSRAAQPRLPDGTPGAWTTIAALLAPLEVAETRIVQTDGGWLPPHLVAQLKTATGSRGAIARADWFVTKLCEPDHYYAFTGIAGQRDEHYAALGVDNQQVVKLLIEKGTNIFSRGPTGKPGRVARFNSLLGGVWATYDVANDNVGLKDPFRDPTHAFQQAAAFDAGESFVQGPNGLWQFDLFDAAGKIVGEADPEVATDGSAPDSDGTLRAPVSCFRCHAQRGTGGLINLTYDQQRILSKTQLTAIDPAEITRLQAFYGRTERLEIELARDREDADAAAREATGQDWNDAALAVAQIRDTYLYTRVNHEIVKRELAVDDLGPLLQSADPLVLAAAANHGFPGILRGQWESAFAEAIGRVTVFSQPQEQNP